MLLEAKDISRKYVSDREEAVVFDRLSVIVNNSDFLMVTGPSGAGKSTLLNILSGLDFPSEGEVFFQGESLSAMDDRKIGLVRNRGFGYIFQSPHLLSDRNVLENVILPFHYGLPVAQQIVVRRCEELLEYVGLAEIAGRYPKTLSGGEMQRVVIARAMARQPKVIFADEPTGSLDFENTEKVVKLLQEQASNGCAVVMATHDTSLLHYGTHHLVLDKRQPKTSTV